MVYLSPPAESVGSQQLTAMVLWRTVPQPMGATLSETGQVYVLHVLPTKASILASLEAIYPFPCQKSGQE